MSCIGTQYNLQEILVAKPEVLSNNQLEKAKNAAFNNGYSLFDSLVGEGTIAEQNLLDLLSVSNFTYKFPLTTIISTVS